MKLTFESRWSFLAPLGLCLASATALGGCNDDGGSRETGASSIGTLDGDGDQGSEGEGTSSAEETSTTNGTTSEEGDDDGPIGEPKFDVGTMPDSPDLCLVPQHIPCDHLDYPSEEQAAWRALGLNCAGEFQADLDYNGHYLALHVLEGPLGTADPLTYPVLEGEKMVILSTGDAFDVIAPGNGDGDTSIPGNDPGNLPAPMDDAKVSDTETCEENPDLVGMGDCSNTIFDQFTDTSGAFDYAEMRFTIEVPTAVSGMAYNVAFLSWEYPDFYGWAYNDMYVAWLESENWTGNITFDDLGEALSLNAGFLDFKDAPNDIDCPLPCSAEELEGTGLEGHGGTRWLETNVGVTAGEQITVIFAIFDIQDNIVDSAVLLDNFHWTCLGGVPGTLVG